MLARSTQFGDIYAFRFTGERARRHSAARAVLRRRRHVAPRLSRRTRRARATSSTGFPLGGTALLFNQTELRFPLIGENIGGVLYHDMGNVYSSVKDLSFRVKQRDLRRFRLHGARRRLRAALSHARSARSASISGYSINPPHFFGFNGTQEDLVKAGVNPCATSPNLCSQQNVSHFQFFFSLGQTF